MERNQELSDKFREFADYLNKIPKIEPQNEPSVTLFFDSEEDIRTAAEATGIDLDVSKFYHSLYCMASTDKDRTGLSVDFYYSRQLKPEEYPEEEKQRQAIAIRQYISDRDQRLLDFIKVLALNGVKDRKQAENIYHTLTSNFKLTPLTDEEKKANEEAENGTI